MKFEIARKRLLTRHILRQIRSVGKSGAVLFMPGPDLKQKTASRFRKAIRLPRLMFWAFMMESLETKNMVRTFVRQGKGHLLLSKDSEPPTEEELRHAIEQLKDLPKFLPFFIFIATPIPGVTESYVLLAVSLEKWLGERFSLLPTHFRNIFVPKKQETPPIEKQTASEG